MGESIRALSEPESGPPAENLVSNEDSYVRVCGELARRAEPGGVFLGVGPEQNLSMIARTRPGVAFIVDRGGSAGIEAAGHPCRAAYSLADLGLA